MATNLAPASIAPCRCGRGGHCCFICGRSEKQIPESEILIRNDMGGICEPCIEKLRQRIERQRNRGGQRA